MKYIDADRLRSEIEHRIEILADVSVKCAKNDDMEMHNYYHGKAVSLEELLPFIGSLNRRSIPDFPITDKDIKEFLATHPKVEVPEKYKTPGFVFKRHEQPEVDLEKEIDKVIADYSFTKTIDSGGFKTTVLDYAKIAKHFYELGLNARKEDWGC